ncbi:transcriptional repressor [Candidatus Roizmanbacteria bacterium]|nr:transcriptional repressor [Candidatus Roizmanbacteria bacterium]
MKYEDIIMRLAGNKHRLTRVRKCMVEFFSSVQSPISVEEILQHLGEISISANKTTVYRELEFLLSQNIIEEVCFHDMKKRYEIAKKHHHHLVCKRCYRVEEVECNNFERELSVVSRRLSQKNHFAYVDHSVEFYGVCDICSQNTIV